MNSSTHTFKSDLNTRAIQLSGTNKLKQERNRAYLFIVLLLAAVIALSIAVVILTKIHTVVPVISVIDANGYVVKQHIADKEILSAQDSYIQSQIYQFIMACNTFDPNWRQHFADLCRLHSTPDVAKQYDKETAPENSHNPYYLIGPTGKRYPKITSLTALEKNAYQVTFQSITEKPANAPQVEYFTALVRYTFTFKPLALGDRWENPLGFAATVYRKDQALSHHEPYQETSAWK